MPKRCTDNLKRVLNTETCMVNFDLFGEQLYLKPKCIDVVKLRLSETVLISEYIVKTDLSRHMHFAWHLKKKILRIPLILNVTVKNLKSILWVIQSNVIKRLVCRNCKRLSDRLGKSVKRNTEKSFS